LEGVKQLKKSPKKPDIAFFDALSMSRFRNFAARAALGCKKKLRFPQFFETALRTVLRIHEKINKSIELWLACSTYESRVFIES